MKHLGFGMMRLPVTGGVMKKTRLFEHAQRWKDEGRILAPPSGESAPHLSGGWRSIYP